MNRKQKVQFENFETKQILWENYAEKYNTLSNLMQNHGLNPELLREVVDSAVKFYTLSISA